MRLDGLRLQVGDPDGSLEPARTAAVDQARAKAEEYAADAGRELGEIVTISEVNDRPYNDQATSPTGRAAAVGKRGVPDPGRASRTCTASIVVVYELK